METTKIEFVFNNQNIIYFYNDVFKEPKYIRDINNFALDYELNIKYDSELDLVVHNSTVLKREEQIKLFEKMNYLKYRTHKEMLHKHPKIASEKLKEANKIKQILVCSNSRLAISTAKKLKPKYFKNEEDIMTLTSHANLTIINCIDMFNPFLGFAPSTYMVNAMVRNILSEKHNNFLPLSEEIDIPDYRVNQFEEISKQNQAKALVKKILSKLDGEDQDLIRKRFGIDGSFYTLDQLAEERSRSKERIRQKQTSIINRLQRILKKEDLKQLKELCA